MKRNETYNRCGLIGALKNDGFTLIEMSVVMVIIAVLAAFAIPVYKDYVVQAKYSQGVTQLDGAARHVMDYAVTNNFSFGALKSGDFSAAEIEATFNMQNTTQLEFLGERTGNRPSDYDFLIYQHMDMDHMRGSPLAPEIIAMAVVISTDRVFLMDCHYYHEANGGWDYPGGEKYMTARCRASTQQEIAAAEDSEDDEGNVDNSTTDPATKKNGNNGHGNNEDGVDSSNPGRGHHKEDASCPYRNKGACVDDEK